MASGYAANAVKTLRRATARVPHTLLACRSLMRELHMIQRSLLLSAFVLLASSVGGAPIALAATVDPTSFVSDLGSRALAQLPNEDTATARQERFRQLFRQYFDVEACARSALGPYWIKATALQRQEFVGLYEDYVVIA